jgi:hypothetical protein
MGKKKTDVAGRIGIADSDDIALSSAVASTDIVKSAECQRKTGVLWEIEDKYSRACAARVVDHFTGQPTQFAMVYGWDGADNKEGSWQAVRPVSDRYKPIRTQDVVDIAVERLKGKPLMEEKIRTDRFGTSIDVKIPIDRPISLKGVPFDQGHPWTRNGQSTNNDVIYPVVNLRNAYDATSSVVVDIGYFRMICSNGMKIMIAGMGSRAIHTKHEIARVMEEVSCKDFEGDKALIQSLAVTKIDTKTALRLMGSRVPEKWQKELTEYAKLGNNTAWAWLNGLSYMSTHEYSLLRSRQLDPVMAAFQQAAAA